MTTNSPIRRLCGELPIVLAVVFGCSMSPPAAAQEPIAVDLISGARLVGQLDTRSDGSRLWLRSEKGSAVLLRPIRWEQVVQARVAGEALTAEQLRRSVEQTPPQDPFREERYGPRSRISLRISPSDPEPQRMVSQWAVGAADGPSTVSRCAKVRSLTVDATVANWDADVEVDGLLVYVYPLDADGRVSAVRGTLQVDLQGQAATTIIRRQSFSRLGYWTRPVRIEDFGSDGAVYRLPFQRVHPEFDAKLSAYGAVHVRLNVPGQGTFEATESTVRIRPYSALRDHLQQATGSRFFPHERTIGR